MEDYNTELPDDCVVFEQYDRSIYDDAEIMYRGMLEIGDAYTNFGVDMDSSTIVDAAEKFFDNCVFYIVRINDTIIGFYWITDIEGESARLHYLPHVSLKAREVMQIGEYVVTYLLEYFDVITCVVPSVNKNAIRFARLMGFTLSDEIKGYFRKSGVHYGYITNQGD